MYEKSAYDSNDSRYIPKSKRTRYSAMTEFMYTKLKTKSDKVIEYSETINTRSKDLKRYNRIRDIAINKHNSDTNTLTIKYIRNRKYRRICAMAVLAMHAHTDKYVNNMQFDTDSSEVRINNR